ncbi:hypothetical protein Tco_1139796 [Tanacetum coccineum]
MVRTAGALSPTRANLLPPHKRYIGTLAMHSSESSDEGSPEMHTKSNMDTNIQADIETASVTIDGLGIKPVMVGVEMGFEPGLVVVESESEPEEAKADDKADVEVQSDGTIEIRVDIATGIDIPDDLLMPDAIERLGQLEEGMQEDELRKVRELQAHESQRLWRMETFMMRTQDYRSIMTITRSGMTLEAIEELISWRVEEALAAQEANRNAGLIDENQTQNGDDNDNGSGGNRNHGNNNGDANQNGGNGGARRDAPVARVCTSHKGVQGFSNLV